MEKTTLSDGEWKLMNLLWDRAPRTIGEMVTALSGDTGWTKATVNIMLNRLEEKGAVRIEKGGRAKLFFPVLAREDAVIREARSTFGRIQAGGLGLLVSTMVKESKLTDDEIDELYNMLKEVRSK